MKDLLTTIARLMGPGGAKAVVADNLDGFRKARHPRELAREDRLRSRKK